MWIPRDYYGFALGTGSVIEHTLGGSLTVKNTTTVSDATPPNLTDYGGDG